MGGSVHLFSQLAAAVPMLLYIAFIWRLDRYEREPLKWVALTFVYGASGGVFLGAMGSLLLMKEFGLSDPLITAGVIAPLTEEPAKALVLFALILFTSHFDNTTDGLVYGAATGLGFAMTENYLYFLNAYAAGGEEAWLYLVVVRSAFSAVMHSCASATFGAVLGYFRFRSRAKQWLVAAPLGFALAAGIHGAFNSALVYGEREHDMEIAHMGLGLVPILSLILFVVTMVSLIREHRMLRDELREEAAMGLLPASHAEIVPFWLKRRRDGWLNPYIHRPTYITKVTLLAFRKHQAKRRSNPPQRITDDIDGLRADIAGMLSS